MYETEESIALALPVKSGKRGDRRWRTQMKVLRRVASDRIKHSPPPHDFDPELVPLYKKARWFGTPEYYLLQPYRYTCQCFYDQGLIGKAKKTTIERSHFGGVKFSLRLFWGGIRVAERKALYREEEPVPTRTRHSVQWNLD